MTTLKIIEVPTTTNVEAHILKIGEFGLIFPPEYSIITGREYGCEW